MLDLKVASKTRNAIFLKFLPTATPLLFAVQVINPLLSYNKKLTFKYQLKSNIIPSHCLKTREMETKHKFLHGTLEATIFHATSYTPPFPFNVSTNY